MYCNPLKRRGSSVVEQLIRKQTRRLTQSHTTHANPEITPTCTTITGERSAPDSPAHGTTVAPMAAPAKH